MMLHPPIVPKYNLIYGEWGFELLADFEYKTVGGSTGLIPAGFWWNGANVPAAFWQFMFSPSDPRILGPSLVHDYLYSTHFYKRSVVDDTFAMYLEKVGAPGYKVSAAKKAVNLFGKKAWKDSDVDKQYMMSLRKLILDSNRQLELYRLK